MESMEIGDALQEMLRAVKEKSVLDLDSPGGTVNVPLSIDEMRTITKGLDKLE